MLPDTRLIRLPSALTHLFLLLARVVVGVVLIAHGWDKLSGEGGVSGTASGFASMGIPLPEVSAWFAVGTEIGGGVLLILGLLTQLAALCAVLLTAGAVWFVHWSNGILVTEGGWELVGVIGAACLMLIAVGPGRISLDGLFTIGRRSRTARASAEG
jgi:putative oxidoreductase